MSSVSIYDVNFLQTTWPVITLALTFGFSWHFAHPHHANRGWVGRRRPPFTTRLTFKTELNFDGYFAYNAKIFLALEHYKIPLHHLVTNNV